MQQAASRTTKHPIALNALSTRIGVWSFLFGPPVYVTARRQRRLSTSSPRRRLVPVVWIVSRWWGRQAGLCRRDCSRPAIVWLGLVSIEGRFSMAPRWRQFDGPRWDLDGNLLDGGFPIANMTKYGRARGANLQGCVRDTAAVDALYCSWALPDAGFLACGVALSCSWTGLQGLRGQGRGRGRGTARCSWKRTRNPQPVDHRLPAVKARHEQRRRKNKGNTVRVERIASHAPVTRLKRCTSTNTHTLTVARHASYPSMYTQSIKRVMKTTAHPHKREQMRHRAQTR